MAGMVLITGAGRRVGAALARTFAGRGDHVVLHYNNSRDEAFALCDELRETGATIHLLAADLAEDTARAELMIAFLSLHAATPDRTPVLINNASLFEYDLPETMEPARFARHQSVNTFAPLDLTARFHAGLASTSQSGIAIAVLDMKLDAPNPDYFSYSLSKAGLAAGIAMAAGRFAPTLKLYAIAPAVLLPSGHQSDANYAAMRDATLLRRPVEIDDVCDAALFLARGLLETGSTIRVDCGQALLRLPRDVAMLSPVEPLG